MRIFLSTILLLSFLASLHAQSYKEQNATKVKLNSNLENSENEIEILSPVLGTSLTLTLPDNDGGIGEVLTSDGFGNLSWTSKESNTLTSNLYYDVYDSQGGQTINGSTITLNLDAERQNPSSTYFSLSSDELTINLEDKFMFIYRVGIDVSSGSNRSDHIAILQRQRASVWSEVEGFRIHEYNRQSGEGASSGMAMGIIDVEEGDVFRVLVWRDSGSDVLITEANSSGLTLFAVKYTGSGPAGPKGDQGDPGQDGANGEKGDPGTASDYINVYDSTGSGVTIDPGPETIPIGQIRNSSGTIFTLTNNNLVLSTTDDFKLEYSITLDQVGGNNRTSWESWIEEDTGSGFLELAGSRSAAYSRNTTNGLDNTNGMAIVEVDGSSTFRLRAEVTSGPGQLSPIQNGTSLIAYTLRGGEQGPSGGTITVVSSGTVTSDFSSSITIGSDGTSGTLNFYQENGLTDYNVSISPSATMSSDLNLILPSSQGTTNSLITNNGSGQLSFISPEDLTQNLRLNVASTGSSDYNAGANDGLIIANNSSTITINLPTAGDVEGKILHVKKVSATGASNNVTVDPNLSETIDGSSSYTLDQQYESISIISDGSNWLIISEINK